MLFLKVFPRAYSLLISFLSMVVQLHILVLHTWLPKDLSDMESPVAGTWRASPAIFPHTEEVAATRMN